MYSPSIINTAMYNLWYIHIFSVSSYEPLPFSHAQPRKGAEYIYTEAVQVYMLHLDFYFLLCFIYVILFRYFILTSFVYPLI